MRKKKISYRLSTLPPIPDDFMLSLAPANIEEAEETEEEVAGADRGGEQYRPQHTCQLIQLSSELVCPHSSGDSDISERPSTENTENDGCRKPDS